MRGKLKEEEHCSVPDDRTKLTDPSEWLQYNLAPPTSRAVFKTARLRLFATHSHHPLVVSICSAVERGGQGGTTPGPAAKGGPRDP